MLTDYFDPLTATTDINTLWLDDLPVGLIRYGTNHSNPQLHYLQPDHLGTPRTVIDPIRNLAIWHWPLLDHPFGDHAPNTDPDADGTSFTLNLRFPGQTFDSETGLHYNYFRDYEPGTGRYIESDPIGLRGGINTYRYSYASPLIYLDPSGLAPQCRPLISINGGKEDILVNRDLINDTGWYLQRVSVDPAAPGRPMMGRPHSSQGGGWGKMLRGSQSGDCWGSRTRTYRESYEIYQLTHQLEMCTETECGNPRAFLRMQTDRQLIGKFQRNDNDTEIATTRMSGMILYFNCLEWIKTLR